MARVIADKWKVLDAGTKQLFEARASVEKARYLAELDDWTNGKLDSTGDVVESSDSAFDPIPLRESPDNDKPENGLSKSSLTQQSEEFEQTTTWLTNAVPLSRTESTERASSIEQSEGNVVETSDAFGNVEASLPRSTWRVAHESCYPRAAETSDIGYSPYHPVTFTSPYYANGGAEGTCCDNQPDGANPTVSARTVPMGTMPMNAWAQTPPWQEAADTMPSEYQEEQLLSTTIQTDRALLLAPAPEKSSTQERFFWPVTDQTDTHMSDISSLSSEHDMDSLDLDIMNALKSDDESTIVSVPHST